jgi:hypothetical protein
MGFETGLIVFVVVAAIVGFIMIVGAVGTARQGPRVLVPTRPAVPRRCAVGDRERMRAFLRRVGIQMALTLAAAIVMVACGVPANENTAVAMAVGLALGLFLPRPGA